MKTKVVNLIIILLTLALTLVAIALLPDVVPVHYDAHGNVDREGSKYELLLLPASLLFVWVLGDKSVGFITKNTKNSDDEKQKSDAKTNEKAVNNTLTITCAVMAVVNIGLLYTTFVNLGSYDLPEIDIAKIATMLMGILLIGMGNIMPKTRANSLLGFRCSWTMYNDNTWRKSNLLGGIVMMILGVLVVIEALIFEGFLSAMIFLGLLTVSLAIILIYAFNVYKKEKNNGDIS